jgi:hypothetical protein
MFFLLRAAFWLTIVLALLPTNSKHPVQSPAIGDAFSAAGAAVSDISHFCDRQPDACAVGSQIATMIGQRAQAGAKMLYELFNEHSSPSATGSVGKTEAGSKPTDATVTAADRGTSTVSERH